MNYRTFFEARFLAFFSFLFLAACASTPTPETYSRVAPGSDFRGIKTYGFLSELSTDKSGFESLETTFLKVAVARQMDSRGLQYDSVNPEVVMNFYIHTDDKVKARQVPAMGGGYYGYRGGYYNGFGYGGAGYETRIEQYTVGTLTIDMIDPKARKLLWEGTISGRLSKKTEQNLEATVEEAVREIFVKFPVIDAQY